jgi:hypothetical protein
MDAIVTNLKDPSWWFSAFFIATIVSVLAGFLKDRLEKLLSNIFSGLKAWRARREEARAKLIESLLADHMYFQIALFRAVMALILFTLFSIMYFSAPVFLATAPPWTDPAIFIDRSYMIWKVFTPIIGVLNILVAYRTTRRLSIISQAIREYRKSNDLPKLL